MIQSLQLEVIYSFHFFIMCLQAIWQAIQVITPYITLHVGGEIEVPVAHLFNLLQSAKEWSFCPRLLMKDSKALDKTQMSVEGLFFPDCSFFVILQCVEKTCEPPTFIPNGLGQVKTNGFDLNFMGLSTFSEICNFKGRKVIEKSAFGGSNAPSAITFEPFGRKISYLGNQCILPNPILRWKDKKFDPKIWSNLANFGSILCLVLAQKIGCLLTALVTCSDFAPTNK